MTVTHVVLALTIFVIVHAADWSYKDPSQWGNHFPSCDDKSQSPIHIETRYAKYESKLIQFDLDGYDTKATHQVINNGHTIQLNIDYTATAKDGGLPGTFKAVQFHFHWSRKESDKGSEHILNNKAYPLEVHIVHMNLAYRNITEALKHRDGLAVLGFFFEVGDENPALNKFLFDLPRDGQTRESGKFSLEELIGSSTKLHHYYRYHGSLTTPPCSEAVVWTVFHKFLTISSKQLDAFWAVADSNGDLMKNYRPLQSLNGRHVYMSWPSSEWNYNNVDSWKDYYPDCAGNSQSPINIETRNVSVHEKVPPIQFSNYKFEQAFNMTNNGHTLQLSITQGNTFIYSGNLRGIYKALQFHFHWNTGSPLSGSEHQIDGMTFPLEMHIVHRNVKYQTNMEALNSSDGFAVLGFFFQRSETGNPEMDIFLNQAQYASESGIKVTLNMAKLIRLSNGMGHFYRYSGSLTTPPCSEAVIWTIFKRPLEISENQLKMFWRLKGHNGEYFYNFRPIRELNGRTVISTF